MNDATETPRPASLAIVCEQFDPRGGGAERNLAEVAQRFTGRGHRVTILAGASPADALLPGAPGVPELPGVTIERGPSGKPRNALRLARFARWAARRLGSDDFDASLSITMAVPATVVQPLGGTVRETLERNLALRRGAVSRGLKRVTLAVSPKQRLLLSLERRTAHSPRVRTIAALSQYVVRQFQHHYGVGPPRVRVITNAVEAPPVNAGQRAAWRTELRAKHAVRDDRVAYLFAALNPRLKGFVPLLHALRRVRDAGVPAVLLATGRYDESHRRLAASLGVETDVRFVGMTQSMPGYYAAADVTVLPTFYDPSSRVVIESLLAGTPAISTAYNGASDFIRREGGALCGRVVDEPDDVPALAAAMTELADPAERDRCRAATEGLGPLLSLDRHVEALEEAMLASDLTTD